ncbi:MAG: hypothetical protein H7322_17105 [Ramlibacter sp.]|nr:hypothetical protein [Ramlibacter sp.]
MNSHRHFVQPAPAPGALPGQGQPERRELRHAGGRLVAGVLIDGIQSRLAQAQAIT